jgi:predicted phage tail protein
VIDFRVSQFDNVSGDWLVIQSGVTAHKYSQTQLTKGGSYQFRVEARNLIGFSTPSDPVQILVATVPATPAQPQTATVVNDLVVSWEAPVSDNGAAISGYSVFVRTASGLQQLPQCSSQLELECSVPLSTLLETPYQLIEGQSVYCAVQAVNSIGASSISSEGNGALLVLSRAPSEPFGLSKESELTTTT